MHIFTQIFWPHFTYFRSEKEEKKYNGGMESKMAVISSHDKLIDVWRGQGWWDIWIFR